ncbi:MAG: DUF452 family protein [Bacteroidales bacterium]|jgi:biotin synthesis protein BioG|nr:DUF452 family protein [Bacteroidales bacterium]
MRIDWCNKKGNDKLILFFNGWGFDTKMFKEFNHQSYDVLMFYQYNSSELNDMPDISSYKEVYVVAWSLGVFMAQYIIKNIEIKKAIAINGTLNPIDDNRGIPESIFRGTIDNLTERNLYKFNARLFGGVRSYDENLLPNGDYKERKVELEWLYNTIKSSDCSEKNIFSRAVISEKDMIFTLQNQSTAWSNSVNDIVYVNGAHFIFRSMDNWDSVIGGL